PWGVTGADRGKCLGNRLAQLRWAEVSKIQKCFYTLWAETGPSRPQSVYHARPGSGSTRYRSFPQ
ncbi:hypothetical protein, partial [Pseudomonas sp. RSP]|uniref:hypothetical protein n=1 Tax=Pseudomonas sp. RSP TaxID=3462641 RepID=UPI004053D947